MILTNISVVKDLMSRHSFAFTKSLGQNFLINPSVCPRMSASLNNPDTVIEIGAGIGVLTRELSKIAKRVIVIEIDESLRPILTETLADCDNVEIIWGDILKLDLQRILTDRNIQRFDICANLPYYIATHAIMKLLESRLPINSVTVMIQEEVAQRFTATPRSKQYGIISVASRFYCDSPPKVLFKVSRGSFIPAPNVDSAVIKLNLAPENHEKRYNIDEKQFFRLVKAAFSERRKQLCNPVSKDFGVSKETVKNALSSLGKNPASRAEELSVDDFVGLCRGLIQ